MITQITTVEWMIEPDNADDREYARLLIRAGKEGLNIDGQATLSWEELNGVAFSIMNQTQKPTWMNEIKHATG